MRFLLAAVIAALTLSCTPPAPPRLCWYHTPDGGYVHQECPGAVPVPEGTPE